MKSFLLILLTLFVLSSCTLVPVGMPPIVTPPVVTPPITTPVVPAGETVLPTTCIDESEGMPVITALSSRSGSVGSTIMMEGCNFAGFEGDKQVWIENTGGTRGIIYSDLLSTSTGITFVLKTPLCQTDTSYSGLDCEASMDLIPGRYQIYVMPWDKVSNKVDFTVVVSSGSAVDPVIKKNLSYEDIKSYVESNITDIISGYSTIPAKNGKWFADGYGFTSVNDVYVDYEDGHSLYRALLQCDNPGNVLACTTVAIFEKDTTWTVIQGEDMVKNSPIMYRSAQDYEWARY